MAFVNILVLKNCLNVLLTNYLSQLETGFKNRLVSTKPTNIFKGIFSIKCQCKDCLPFTLDVIPHFQNSVVSLQISFHHGDSSRRVEIFKLKFLEKLANSLKTNSSPLPPTTLNRISKILFHFCKKSLMKYLDFCF